MTDIMTPISPGELLDKLTILNIKSKNITDATKLANVVVEQSALQSVVDAEIEPSSEITDLTIALQTVNKELWDIEDDIRDCERSKDFGAKFVDLARAVYVTNDKRSELKKQINLFLGSRLVEEKSYAAY
jgi:hypothetical protein